MHSSLQCSWPSLKKTIFWQPPETPCNEVRLSAVLLRPEAAPLRPPGAHCIGGLSGPARAVGRPHRNGGAAMPAAGKEVWGPLGASWVPPGGLLGAQAGPLELILADLKPS